MIQHETLTWQDIDALKNQKIQEMIQLLDIKTSKEKYMTELEGLRSEIAKERAVLATLKSCSAPPAPALDLSSSDSGEEAGHSLIPSLAPAQRGQARPRDMRQHPARPDYYRHMFDPSAAKVPRLCEGKGREYNNLLAGGLPQANHQPLHHPQLQHHPPHHPPMMHYMGHHNQPVNLSRAMDPEIAEKTRMSPAVNLHQMQAIYKVSQSHSHGGQEQARPGPVTSASAFGLPGPPHLPHHSYLAAARQRLLPPTSLDTESKCEVCGSPANFMCSACKLVHYCSAACQVTLTSELLTFIFQCFSLRRDTGACTGDLAENYRVLLLVIVSCYIEVCYILCVTCESYIEKLIIYKHFSFEILNKTFIIFLIYFLLTT